MAEIKKEILKLLKSKIQSSSFILLPNFYKSDYFHIKFVWLFLTLVAISWCSWLMSKTIIDYLNYDVITKTEVKYQTLMIFPTITFCHANPYTTDYSRQHLDSLIDWSDPDIPKDFMINYLINYNITNNLTDKYLFGKKIDELIITCSFGLEECNLTEDFEHYYDFELGNCYRFNSGINMNGKKVELKYVNGLFGNLDVQVWIGAAENNYNYFSYTNGLIVFIGNKSDNSLLSNGINVSPGYETKISLERLTIIKKSQPYSYCVENLNKIDSYDSLTYKKSIQQRPNKTYNFMDCYLLCMQKKFGDKCGCQMKYIDLYYYKEMRLCYLNETLRKKDNECFYKNLKSFLKDSKTYLKVCDCPLECEYNFYKYFNSFAEFPTRNYLPYLINTSLVQSMFKNNNDQRFINDSLETFDLIRKSVARIQINYQDMMQTFITEYPKTSPTDLVSSLGGILGLFMGLSFLSFIEIFDFAIQFSFILMKYISGNKKTRTSPNNNLNIENLD
jgi:hypothetical protein